MATNFTEVIISGSKPLQIPFGHIPVSDGSGSFTHEAGTIFIASSSNQYLVASGANKTGIPNARDLVHSTGLKVSDSGVGGTLEIEVDDNQIAFLSGANFLGAVSASIRLKEGSNGVLTGSVTKLQDGSPFITSNGTITTETGSSGEITLKQASPFFIPFFNGVVTRSEGDTFPTTMGGNHIDTSEYAGFLTATMQVLMSVPTASLSGVFQLFDLFESASIATLTGSSETIDNYILYESSGNLFTGSRSYKLEAYTNADDSATGDVKIIMARVKLTP